MATVDHSPRCTLPTGTYVQVQELPHRGGLRYRGKIVGYDMGRTKYQVGRELWRGHFLDGGMWAFPGEVEEITEEEANR